MQQVCEADPAAYTEIMDLLDRMLGHDVLTTNQLLMHASDLSDEQLDQRFDVDDRSLRECFEHVIANMEVWTDLMFGWAVTDRSGTSVPELQHRPRAAGCDLAELSRSIARENRWDDVFVDVLDHPPRKKTLGGGVGHILTHRVHHRAQIMYMLEKLGQTEHVEGDLLMWESIAFSWA
jgi:uncharacterized damage-inducible protein DinB